MKKLMMTTAIVAVTSLGAIAQTAPDATAPAAQGQMQAQAQGQTNVPAFLASDFTGMDLYTLDHESVRDLRARGDVAPGAPGAQTAPAGADQGAAPAAAPGAAQDTQMGMQQGAQPGMAGQGYQDRSVRWTSSDAFTAQRDAWDNIGNIGDVVMTQDGEIRGVIVDVGGFLGMFTHTVMIDLDDLYFVADDGATTDGVLGTDGMRNFFVVASMSREQLEAMPEWDDAQLTAGFEARHHYGMGQQGMGQQGMGQQGMGQQGMGQPAQQGMDQEAGQQPGVAPVDQQAGLADTGQADPAMQADTAATTEQQPGTATDYTAQGYTEMAITDERTADALTGANVYDAADDNIGNVTDLVLGDDASVTHILVDVGGFLGMGSHTVALPVEEVNILWHDQNNDVRVHVQTTREQLETMPEHQG